MQSFFDKVLEYQKNYFFKLNNNGHFLSKKYHLVFSFNILSKGSRVYDEGEHNKVVFKDKQDLDYFVKELELYHPDRFCSRVEFEGNPYPIAIQIKKLRNLEHQDSL